MLHLDPVRQSHGEYPRQWVSDDYFDLILWYEADGNLHGFQLCYGKGLPQEYVLSWTPRGGFVHAAIDSGESCAMANRTPLMVGTGRPFPADIVRAEFVARSADLPENVRNWVLGKLSEYAARKS